MGDMLSREIERAVKESRDMSSSDGKSFAELYGEWLKEFWEKVE